MKEIRCDNGGEYTNKGFYELAIQEGIYFKTWPTFTHEFNGVAERYNQTIMNQTHCLLTKAIARMHIQRWFYWKLFIGKHNGKKNDI